MPGPFPGMDPYLENHWGDVHTRLIVGISDQLQEQLPRGLRARIEEHVAVEIEDERRARVRPDVRVVERVPVGSGRSAAALAEDAADELIVELDAEAATERTVYIIDLSTGGRVITSIEVLSPGNKETVEDRERFQAKQRELLREGVSLVEIDLIRQGGWTVSVPQRELPLAYGYPYRLVVRRGNEPTPAICRKAPLQERLPVIRIPLRASDQDVTLDLQQVVDDAWRKGGYDDLDYANEPMPPFSEADAAWVRERIRTV